MTDFAGRVRGMLYGLAFGDALGAIVEKLSAAEIAARYGRVTSIETAWHLADAPVDARRGRIRGNGIVTDDTHMTLCLMSLYGEAGRHLDAWDMAGGMVREIAWKRRWLAELQREDMLLERLFYPERWIFIRHQLANCEPREGGLGNMINCGAAMYIAPIGAVNPGDPRAAYDEAIAFAQGHQASYGLEAAGVLAACVAAAFIPGMTAAGIVETALSVARDGSRAAIADIAGDAERLRGRRHAEVTAAFHATIARYSSMGDDVGRRADKAGLPTADYTPSRLRAIEELPIALGFLLLNEGDFRVSVEDGINSGRDTDSIGAMAGAILGAMHGPCIITEPELDRLNTANRLDLPAAAEAFIGAAARILADDRRRGETIRATREALGV